MIESSQFRLVREIAALRRVVAHMREELRGAEDLVKSARHMALHDDLTALPNRRFFRERLQRALEKDGERSPELAVIYLDLDGFKAINDTHGHETGDRLLNLVAARITSAMRAEDLVSRLGGDEFACLVNGVCRCERLQEIGSTLFEAVSRPFTIGSLVLEVRPSIGIAMCPGDGITADVLLERADAAMYRAKRTRSTWAFAERPARVPPLEIVSAAGVPRVRS
jgi:diguanylate cyclase (GGDEF)-like protein